MIKFFNKLPIFNTPLVHLPKANYWFTNDTIKKSFDAEVKKKYESIPRVKEDKEEKDAKSLYDQMRDAYEDAFIEYEDEKSVLSKYKDQIEEDTSQITISDDSANTERMKLHLAAMRQFTGLNDNQFLEKSREIMNLLRTKREWNPHQREIDYSEFTSEKYEKSQVDIDDHRPTRIRKLEGYDLRKRLQDYIFGLDEKSAEQKDLKYYVEDIKNELMKQGYNAEDADKRVRDELMLIGFDDTKYRPMDTNINFGDEDDDPHEGALRHVRLSIEAKDELYSLYKRGWNVRDLSIRFGILPERAKFIVWSNEYFYTVVAPSVDLTMLRLMYEREYQYMANNPHTDYGLDLEDMAKRRDGIHITTFSSCELDASADDSIKKRMEHVLRHQTKKKYDIVTEGFVGRGDNGYYIKSWQVYKGHGSERVTKKFQNILKFQGKATNMINDTVRGKMKKGPRHASRGFGIK